MPLMNKSQRKRLAESLANLSEGKDSDGNPIDFEKISNDIRRETMEFAEQIRKGEEEGRRIFSGNTYVG